MDLAGSRWVLMDTDGSRWILRDLEGSRWVPMDPDGSQWIPMDPDGPDTHLVPNPLPEAQVEDQLCEVEGALHSCSLWTFYFEEMNSSKSPKPKTTYIVGRERGGGAEGR